MRLTNYPLVTLGALCGWVVGYFLTTLLPWLPLGEFQFATALYIQPLCVLGGAALFTLFTPLPERPNADPVEDEKHPLPPPTPFRRFCALFCPSCGMTWSQRVIHAALWAIFLILMLMACGSFFQRLMELLFHATSPQQHATQAVANNIHNPIMLLLLGLPSCILAPVSEELLYRHLIPETLMKFFFPELLAVILSASLFAAAHLLFWAMPGFFLFALVQSYIVKKTDLLQSIFIHCLYNLFTLALVLYTASYANHG